LNTERDKALVADLRGLDSETSCCEFKVNVQKPEVIGKYISALANAAAFSDEAFAYIVWGIQNETHEIVGTNFDPKSTVVQNEPLEFWLAKRLQPDVPFEFREIDCSGARIILLAIPAATKAPVEFDRIAYIRISSATPRLSDHPERHRALWSKLQPRLWEDGISAEFVTSDRVLSMIDYASYFDLTEQPLPDNRVGIFDRLSQERIIIPDVGGRWNISNLGAILFAKNLDDFGGSMKRKAIRLTIYAGTARHDTVTHRREGTKGYASGFSGLVNHIRDLLPSNEYIGPAFRTSKPIFPEIAIRELIANALIHQDLTIRGSGPSIQIFTDRMEITNPGSPLVSTDRFIDAVPLSRNETLAALMRRMKLCEEEGTGIDKVVAAVELYQSPPPEFQALEEPQATRVIIQSPREFAAMTVEERTRACYQHCVLRKLQGEVMRNATLRQRFGVEPANKSQISKVIGAALEQGLIKPSDPEKPRAGYVPFWSI